MARRWLIALFAGGATLGVQDCGPNEVLRRNTGDTAGARLIRTLHSFLVVLAVALPSLALPAFDASSALGAFPIGNFSWNHTPVGAPRGIIVFTVTVGAADQIASVTYGGMAMEECPGSPNEKPTPEAGSVSCWFLGSNVPAGVQSISVTVNGTQLKTGFAISYSAAADMAVAATNEAINSDSSANPSSTIALGAATSAVAIGFFSGHNVPTSYAPFPGWTDRGEQDMGSQGSGSYTYDTVGSSNVTAGWTQAAEDAVSFVVAVKERPQGHVIEDEGTPLPQQTNLNFTGTGVSCADSGGKTVCTALGTGALYEVRSIADWNAVWTSNPSQSVVIVRLMADLASPGTNLPHFYVDMSSGNFDGKDIIIDGNGFTLSAREYQVLERPGLFPRTVSLGFNPQGG